MSMIDEATAPWHAVAQAPWIQLAERARTRGDYAAALVRTYGFVAPLECACRYTPGLDRLLETRALTRTGLLVQDLLALGFSPARITELPQCYWVASFQELPEALGWLYVVSQWARVLGEIRHHIVRPERRIADAATYITAIGERSDTQWLAFERTLERIVAHHSDAVVTAAIAGFETLERLAETIPAETWRKTA